MLFNLCGPSILYLGFSITQIIIDLFKNMYNTAILKFMIMIFFTLILNVLCSKGLTTISWFIVFIPFILMTIITSILLFVFGLSPSSGNFDYNIYYPPNYKNNQPHHQNYIYNEQHQQNNEHYYNEQHQQNNEHYKKEHNQNNKY